MTTVDQFLYALAIVESSNTPEAWGDGGRAMGRWQVHPDRFWDECRRGYIFPKVGETWDSVVERILRAVWEFYFDKLDPVAIAMYWHLGHFTSRASQDWDTTYASKFAAALAKVSAQAGA